MNRSTAAAIAVAAVLGVTGGTWLGATVGTNDDPDGGDLGDTVSPSTTKTGRKPPTTPPPGSSPAQLLYMDATTIHDGYTHVAVEGFTLEEVDSLVRLRGGWLVIERTPGDPSFRASTVNVSGEVTELGSFTGAWDISEDGDRFVALRGHDYTVFDVATGEPEDLEVEAPQDTEPSGDVAFGLSAILTGWVDAEGTRSTVRTDLSNARSRAIQTGTLAGWVASPRGLLIAGQVSNGSITCLRGGAVSDSQDWWTACDWTLAESRPKYSPDGKQLLVVPLDPDGGPPATYGVLASGNGVLITTIDAPRFAVDAEWGDNNEVFVLARKTPRSPATMLYRCEVRGECVLERPGTAPLVLGVGV